MAKLLTGTRIYGTANVDTSIAVGSNVIVNTSVVFVGNTSVNASINATAISFNGVSLTASIINAAACTNFSNTQASTNNISGAVIIAGGLGVNGNIYTAGRVGFANTANVSVVYTYYNATTNSMDVVFG